MNKIRDWLAYRIWWLADKIDTHEETYTVIKYSNRTIGTSWALITNDCVGHGFSGGCTLAESDDYYDGVQAWPKIKDFTDIEEALEWGWADPS